MAGNTSPVALVGCTGLVGSHILTTLTSLPTSPLIHALARKPLPATSPTLTPHIEPSSSSWPSILKSLSPSPKVFISALGTTKAQAGSFEAQRKIDYDLNLSLAKAARESGADTYVLISSSAVSTSSMFPYSKMKAELEEAVKELGFPQTVILKPGLLMGERKDSRPAEAVVRFVAKGMKKLGGAALTDWWAQDADVIAKAAVSAGLACAGGKREKGLWVVEQSEIVRLGRKEWEGEKVGEEVEKL